ncbi:MAG: hypothetical protein M1817_004733 [Caeruleum heppii]|nr:MAG: hypothetical protein M1817_004733 [Caeruleum heppii]
MATTTLSTVPLESLQSSDERDLLDGIDKLRSQGISHYVALPQLIVCGDQSSGKSSVLEAISGIPFPTKDNLCTRFATELILRRTANANISVAIVPSQTRPESECQRLSSFRETLVTFDEFPNLLDRAKDVMGISTTTTAFSSDVLRVEISGPDRPHLSIVDLPGLIHSENKLQTAADVQLVLEMVKNYMANRRSIILAVVSAKNDYANQIVLKLSKEVDPKGHRTLGVITKPDTLPVGSDSEVGFANLARNQDVEFRLGWHVLKNRDYESRNATTEARDVAEETILSQGIWQGLPRELVGIRALRHRLSKVLLEHIRAELPGLVTDIEAHIQRYQGQLDKLGDSRAGLDEQRLFLLRISQTFQSLVKAAVDGTYDDAFFGDPRSGPGYGKRLRAVVQNLNLDFAETIRSRGHRWHIVDETEDGESSSHTIQAAAGFPESITHEDYISMVRELLRTSRGRELPGMFNALIVGDLFWEQSKPWEAISQRHIQETWDATRTFLDLVMSHLADETTAEALLKEVVDPVMEFKISELNEKLKELLAPYQRGHPITYNHHFTETIQSLREKRLKAQVAERLEEHFLGLDDLPQVEQHQATRAQVKSLVAVLSARNEADMDRYACHEALDCMQAYYKVSMKSAVDNIVIHAIENILVAKLGEILSPSFVMQMDFELVSKIAAESQESQDQRVQLSRTLGVLRAGAVTCKRYAGRNKAGKYPPGLERNQKLNLLVLQGFDRIRLLFKDVLSIKESSDPEPPPIVTHSQFSTRKSAKKKGTKRGKGWNVEESDD